MSFVVFLLQMNATTPIYSKGKYIEIIREVFSYLKKFGYDT